MRAHLTAAIHAFRGLLDGAGRHRAGAMFMLATGPFIISAGILVLVAIWLIRH